MGKRDRKFVSEEFEPVARPNDKEARQIAHRRASKKREWEEEKRERSENKWR